MEARYEGEDLTVAFNPQYLIDGLTAAVGRVGPARRPRRAEAGRRARRGRRVHLPRDAGAAAGRRVAERLRRRASPSCGWRGWSSATSGTTPTRRSTTSPTGWSSSVGPERRGQDEPPRGDARSSTRSAARGVSSSEPLVREGTEAGYVRGEFETLERPGARRGRGPRRAGANRVQVNRSPVRRKRDLRRQVRGGPVRAVRPARS